MATQRCPKCKSSRVRLGYRHTSTISKLLFRYYLLCDDCNWEFKGFAIPGTVTKKTKKKRTNEKKPNQNDFSANDIDLIQETLKIKDSNHKMKLNDDGIELTNNSLLRSKVRKKVKVKLF